MRANVADDRARRNYYSVSTSGWRLMCHSPSGPDSMLKRRAQRMQRT